MLKFYRWLMWWAHEKTKDLVKCNVKCPKCLIWSSAIDGEYVDNTNWGYKFKCGNCDNEQWYNAAAFPFPHPSDENGNPTTELKRLEK